VLVLFCMGRHIICTYTYNPYGCEWNYAFRWQLNSRLANGGGKPIQKDIYLRDWSIKNELRNRALIYDNGAYETTDYVSESLSLFCSPNFFVGASAMGEGWWRQ
jgi:hypothetical protein